MNPLSSNEKCVRNVLKEWIKLPDRERDEEATNFLHQIYGNMCSTDERSEDGDSLDALWEARNK